MISIRIPSSEKRANRVFNLEFYIVRNFRIVLELTRTANLVAERHKSRNLENKN